MPTNVEQVREKTLEILGSTDPADVRHITTELIADGASAPPSDDAAEGRPTYFGHSMAYGHNNGEYGYWFRTGDKYARSRDCGSQYRYWIAHSLYDHNKVGECGAGNALLQFSPR
jgi:hypothetical protein